MGIFCYIIMSSLHLAHYLRKYMLVNILVGHLRKIAPCEIDVFYPSVSKCIPVVLLVENKDTIFAALNY